MTLIGPVQLKQFCDSINTAVFFKICMLLDIVFLFPKMIMEKRTGKKSRIGIMSLRRSMQKRLLLSIMKNFPLTVKELNTTNNFKTEQKEKMKYTYWKNLLNFIFLLIDIFVWRTAQHWKITHRYKM